MKNTGFISKKSIGWGLVILIHMCFFVYQYFHMHLYSNDSYEYLWAAQNLKEYLILYSGDLSKPIETDLYSFRTIGYPLFLAFIKIFTDKDIAIIFLQNIISIFNILLVVKILKRLHYEWDNYLYLPFIFILIPAQLIYANMIMSEILLQSNILLAFYFLIKYNTNPSKQNTLLYHNIALGLGILIKPVLMLVFIPNIATGIYYYLKTKSIKVIFISLIPAFVVGTYCTFNYQKTGFFHYSSMGHHNLLNYNAYYMLLGVIGEEKADSTIASINSKAHHTDSYVAYAKVIQHDALNIILEHPFNYLKCHTKGMVTALIDPGRFDWYYFFDLKQEEGKGLLYHINNDNFKGVLNYLLSLNIVVLLLLIIILIANIIRTGLLFSSIFKSNINVFLKSWCLLMIGYIIFITGPLGASRFLFPVAPLIAIMAIISLKSYQRKSIK
jgi:4-amino-4-deoxy-L-arabinose transferase-like glycosyltransferase